MTFRPLCDAQASIRNLQDEMNHLMERVWHAGVSTGPFDGQAWAPAADLCEQNDRYVVRLEVPGVNADTISVTYAANVLTVRGEKPCPQGMSEGDRVLRGERRYGSFCRNIELPAGIDADRVSAKCQGGVLEISVPKSPASMPKSVRINVGAE